MKVSVSPQRDLQQLTSLVREWEDRTKRVMKMVSFWAAAAVLEDLKKMIPPEGSYRVYRNSLRAVGVAGDPFCFAVQANPRVSKVKKIDAQKTVIYVKPLGRMGRAKPAVYVLRKWGPWTVETLPFAPPQNEAKIEYRTVSPSFVRRVAVRNKEQRHLWRRTMGKVGKRSMSAKLSEFPHGVQGLADTALDVFRLEFGMNGVKARPHWRPALRKLARTGLSLISQDRRLIAALSDVSYQGWRSWRTPTTKVSKADAQNFAPFQRKLGVFR